jgi:hypothetical protein
MKSTKKGPGRPKTGTGELVGIRIQPDDLAAIDEWAAVNGCTRQEAIRRLVKRGLLKDRKEG